MTILLSRWISPSPGLRSNLRSSAVLGFLQVQSVRSYSVTPHSRQAKSRMEVELTAPNGKKWMQPLGLFINNEFVQSSKEQRITSINPTFVATYTTGTRREILRS